MAAEQPNSNPSVDPAGADEKTRAKARIGTTINGKYKLEALLGIGGMATVYAATHRNGSRIALKLLHSEFARDVGIRDRFLREGYVANKAEHPGRVSVLDDDVTENDEPFLVMELLEGDTLQQLWKKRSRKVPVPEALDLAAQSLDVLHAYHLAGIVHRDIKPANLFLNRDGVVKLLDFGVARMHEPGSDRTRAGTALGTPSFMAPEQAMGLTDGIDGRADVFSIGATLYALLSGQRLHQGRSDNEAFILAATQPAPSVARVAPELPVEVIALVDKALAWDARNRFETAAAMRDECLRLLEQYAPSRKATVNTPANRTGEVSVGGGMVNAGFAPATAPAASAAPEAPVELPAMENDPAVVRLVDAFRKLERLLPAVRQYGWAHPEAELKLRATHQAFVEALREDTNAVHWSVLPYSFIHRTQTIWEPAAPFDVVPYNLFAAGIRTFRARAGVEESEIRALASVFLLDPNKDLTPEDDIGSALWERQMTNIKYDAINVFADGDAADREAFYEEADEMEALARKAADQRADRAEAAAMNVRVDAEAMGVARAAAKILQIDNVAKKALSLQLETSPERWSERFIEVLADAFVDTLRRRDPQLLAEPLDSSARDLVLARRIDVVFPMFEALVRAVQGSLASQRVPGVEPNQVRAQLARAMFSPETLRLLLVEAVRSNQQAVLQQGSPLGSVIDLNQLTVQLAPLLAEFGNEHVSAVGDVIDQVQHEGLRQALFSFLQRAMAGREADIADRIPQMSLESARPMLKLLASIKTPGAVEALRKLAQATDPNLRCEAVAHAASTPEQLRDDLNRLVDAPNPELRQAALRAMANHQVKAAGPLLMKRVQDPTFNQLPVDERRELFTALYALFPQRGEQLAMEIVQKHGLLVDDDLELTRALCAELLGQHAKSQEALEAVLQAVRKRWWNTQLLRDAALVAAEAIAARIGRRISPAGELIG